VKKRNVDGAIHAIGNGRLLVYGRGADVHNVYGTPYTTPSLLSGAWKWKDGETPVYASYREKGTSIWNHQFYKRDRLLGTARELIHPVMPAYFKKLVFEEEMDLVCTLPEGYSHHVVKTNASGTIFAGHDQLLVVSPDTARILFYPSGTRSYLSVVCWGEGWGGSFIEGNTVSLKFGKGIGYLALISGSSYPEAMLQTEQALRIPFEEHAIQAYQEGRSFASRIRIPNPTRTVESELMERIRELCENTAFQICAQQSEDGGIMAGHLYPLAYKRDQYGTCRGLLALGLAEEAKRNLEFRFAKWKHFGSLRNAEAMGHHRIRHLHENDDVEVTAYTILQTLDYAAETHDWAFVEKLFPMLDWCWKAQLPHLMGGMLPFNGDETSREMVVNSAGLLPSFIHSGVLQPHEKALGTVRAVNTFTQKGYLPTTEGSERFVGYDAGLLLYALTDLDHPLAEEVFRHVVDIADSTGSWVEYYEKGAPQGCRCRPWESGINIAAGVHFLTKGGGKQDEQC
jgi:hypothetical protein